MNFFLILFQSLKNCFIELERHFNVLEINKFGEDDRSHSHVGGRASQSRLRNSRLKKVLMHIIRA